MTTHARRPPHGHDPQDHPNTYSNRGNEEMPPPQGRLVLVLEHELSEASRASLHRILETLVDGRDVTMVSGLSRASMLQAEAVGSGLFYNRREYLSPESAFRMLPWREIWLVAGGRVWTLSPHQP